MTLKVALKFLKNFKILKKLSRKNAIFKHFWGFFACFYAILAFRDNRVSPATIVPILRRNDFLLPKSDPCAEHANLLSRVRVTRSRRLPRRTMRCSVAPLLTNRLLQFGCLFCSILAETKDKVNRCRSFFPCSHTEKGEPVGLSRFSVFHPNIGALWETLLFRNPHRETHSRQRRDLVSCAFAGRAPDKAIRIPYRR